MEFKTLRIEKKENFAILYIDNGKVNAINTQLLVDLKEALNGLHDNSEIRGVILAGRPHAFSAGLDIMHIASLDEEGGINFWIKYMEVLQTMVQFHKPLICAITGYAPAGATILTLCTDYRVMGRGAKHVIGMHEFKMHMQIPEMLCDVYAYHLGEVEAWKAIQQRKLFNSDEACEIGLVDESVEVEEVLERAEIFLKQQIHVYPKVYAASKRILRKDLYKIVVERDIQQLAEETIAFNSDPELQAKVIEFMTSLMNKNKA